MIKIPKKYLENDVQTNIRYSEKLIDDWTKAMSNSLGVDITEIKYQTILRRYLKEKMISDIETLKKGKKIKK